MCHNFHTEAFARGLH